MSKLYKSGEIPKIGDRVKVIDDTAKTGYYSSRITLEKNRVYTVSGATTSGKSTLVAIKNKHNTFKNFKASRFSLVESNDSIQSKGPAKYLIVNTNGKASGVAYDDEKLQLKLSNLLLTNPTAEYHIFSYTSTAKTSLPKVEFFVAKPKKIVAQPITTPDPGDTFRKK